MTTRKKRSPKNTPRAAKPDHQAEADRGSETPPVEILPPPGPVAAARRVRIRNGDLQAEVDEHLAAWVEGLWGLGFKSIKSCHYEGDTLHLLVTCPKEGVQLCAMLSNRDNPPQPEVTGGDAVESAGTPKKRSTPKKSRTGQRDK